MGRRAFLGRLARAGLAAGLLPGTIGKALASERLDADFPETCRAWRAMGTLIEVRIPDLPKTDAVEAIRRVRERVETLEAVMTLYRPQSPLVALNRQPEMRWLEVPPELIRGMTAALDGCRESEGAFDPTVAPAMRAWGLYELSGKSVDLQLLRAWRKRPTSDAIDIDSNNRRVRRHDSRVEVDLGGVGKGMAVDAALEALRRAGSESALVNLGGSIGVLGAPSGNPEGWSIGIAHPRRPGEVWTTFSLRRGHVATSGDYERRHRTPEGQKHHLLDPKSGEPTQGVASLTVQADSGAIADIQSTTEFVRAARGEKPPEESARVLAVVPA
jgi:thiamine biosynthesis lipoprotein